MRYLLILLVLATSCSSLRKAVDKQKQEVNKALLSFTDSIGRLKVDSTSTKLTTGWVTTSVDSGYDKVIEEEVKEVIDSGIVRRETKRVIKEKGQKRVEQSSTVSQYDSTGKKADQIAEVKQLQKQDSSGVTVALQKDIKRTTLFPWWLWLIVLVVALAFAWWKRNPIIKFFT